MKTLLFIFLSITAYAGSPQGVPVQSTVSCLSTNTLLVAQNNNRGYLLMQSQGSDTTGHCHLKAGSAITGTEGLWVNSGQNYETVEAFTKQPWYCKCDTTSQTFEVLQTNW
jgi:hypothetical protein